MPNAAVLIRESIWRNLDFRKLPRRVQCTYLQLCSQKDLDCAGMLTLNIGMLAKGCGEISEDDIRSDLTFLEKARFSFFDEDTYEIFVRAYMRTAEVVRSPNVFKSALRAARLVSSEKLRVEVAAELRRLRRAEADAVADLLDPSGTLRPDPTNGSGTLPENETLSKPSSTVTSTGTISCSVVGHFGEARPQCRKHPENSDERCGPCMRRREWDERHEADELEHKRAARAASALIAQTCPDCQGTNVVEAGEDSVRKCDHRGRAHA